MNNPELMEDPDYNDLLQQVRQSAVHIIPALINQILTHPNMQKVSANLRNTLNTFGPSSYQHQEVLNTLRSLLQRIDQRREDPVEPSSSVDPEILSRAMSFLKLS